MNSHFECCSFISFHISKSKMAAARRINSIGRRAALSTAANMSRQIRIAVHGGAWAIPDELVDLNIKGVSGAAMAALGALKEGACPAEAAKAAVISLEENPVFDAGFGSVLNEDGNVEMDAMIMDGQDLSVGAVVGLRNVASPVSLANAVRTRTDHCLFAGEGASRIAEALGFETIDPASLVTDAGRQEWELFKKYGHTVSELFREREHSRQHDTVGCVVFVDGHCAAATSTGGITAKKVGRVGDSAIVGSGGFADNELGAISTTGHGESIMRVALGLRVLQDAATRSAQARPDGDRQLDAAAIAGLQFMTDRVAGQGGLVAVSPTGELSLRHTTPRMAWASLSSGDADSLEAGITRERG